MSVVTRQKHFLLKQSSLKFLLNLSLSIIMLLNILR